MALADWVNQFLPDRPDDGNGGTAAKTSGPDPLTQIAGSLVQAGFDAANQSLGIKKLAPSVTSGSDVSDSKTSAKFDYRTIVMIGAAVVGAVLLARLLWKR